MTLFRLEEMVVNSFKKRGKFHLRNHECIDWVDDRVQLLLPPMHRSCIWVRGGRRNHGPSSTAHTQPTNDRIHSFKTNWKLQTKFEIDCYLLEIVSLFTRHLVRCRDSVWWVWIFRRFLFPMSFCKRSARLNRCHFSKFNYRIKVSVECLT